MNRATVLRDFTKVLERHTALTSYLDHTAQATSITAGARIIGASTGLNELPTPSVIIGIGQGSGRAPQREAAEWNVTLTLIDRDVYKLATLLDHVEDACLEYRTNQFSPALSVRAAMPGTHEGMTLEAPQGQLLALLVNINLRYVNT